MGDLDWIGDAESFVGDYIIKKKGGGRSYVSVVEEYSHGPNSQRAIKFYKGDKLPITQHTDNQGQGLVSNLVEKLERGQWEKIDVDLHNVNESDFEWAEEIDANLTVGNQYYVKSGNGIYWMSVEYCGRGKSEMSGEGVDGHKFKNIGSDRCNEWWSHQSLMSKIDNDLIRDYDPNWSIKDDVEFGSLNDIKGRNFVIYFEGGVDIDDTISLQERLLTMGFSFPGSDDKVITSEQNKKRISMFECYNWDDTNERYSGMPNDFRDKGLMLLVDSEIDTSMWGTKDPEKELQNTFSTVVDHNAIVIDGNVLLGGEINESDFDWVDSIGDPLDWVEHNVEKGENGHGEIWVDFGGHTKEEKIQIIKTIEDHLGSSLIFQMGGDMDDYNTKLDSCTDAGINGLLLHCGHEEYDYLPQENHVCCMGQTYESFMNVENRQNSETHQRPRVDGGVFLGGEPMNEGFFYKGVNPTVDLIVIRGDNVLLIQRSDDAEVEPGKWAIPGGFHDTNAKEGEEWKEDKESSLDAAKREVKEETGLDVDSIEGELNFEMVGVYEGGGRDPRDKEDAWTRSTVYMVYIPEDEGHDVKGMDDAQRAEWVPIDKVLQHKLAFDHHKIIEKALSMNESDAFSHLGSLITESGDFEWAENVGVTTGAIQDLLSNCSDVKVGHYNIDVHSFYTIAGKVYTSYYSMCPYWWDRFGELPLDDNGRGPGDWFTDRRGIGTKVAALNINDRSLDSPDEIRSLDIDLIDGITYDLSDVAKYFNGLRSELWFFFDDNGEPRYDLMPIDLVDEVRKDFERLNPVVNESIKLPIEIGDEILMGKFKNKKVIVKTIEWNAKGDLLINGKPSLKMRLPKKKKKLKESDFDWTDEASEVFVGMIFKVRDSEKMVQVIDIVGTKVTWKVIVPTHGSLGMTDMGKAVHLIDINHWIPQLVESVGSDFDWIDDVPDYDGYRFFDVHVCYESFYDEETGEDECYGGDSYFLKITKDETEKIWDLDVWDNGGPGDEGEGVIRWGQENGVFDEDEDDYVDVDYVMEIPREEFCRAVGDKHKDVCPQEQLKESDFDWVGEVEPITAGMVFKVLGNDYPNQIVAKMEVIKVTTDEVIFQNRTTTQTGGLSHTVSLEKALQLVDEKYWVPNDVMGNDRDSWGDKVKGSH